VLGSVDLILVMSVNPGFGGQSFLSEVLPKVGAIRRMIDASGRAIDLEIDGGIGEKNAREATQAGARVLVAGNAIFTNPTSRGGYKGAISGIRQEGLAGITGSGS
jgi:ribulose-phosphate 3-epimerase